MTYSEYLQFFGLRNLRNLAFVVPCLLLAGCAAKRDNYDVPALNLPKQYAKAPPVVDIVNSKNTATSSTNAATPSTSVPLTPVAASPLSAALAEWWRLLGSQELNGLMDRALANNPDLRIATLRIAQSRARLDQSGSAKLPTISIPVQSKNEYPDLGIGRANPNGNSKSRTTHQISLRGDWRPDLWGETASLYESADLQLLRATYQRDDKQRTMVENVVVTYLEYLSLNDRLRVARETEQSLGEMLVSAGERLTIGDATITEIEQQKVAVYLVKATIPVLSQQREVVLNRLASLVGSAPEALKLSNSGFNTVKFPAVLPGVPSALLLRRPDVRAVEAQLLAADADIDVARARVLPPLDLTAQVGYGSTHMSKLFLPQALFWSTIANLSATVFDSGKRAKEVEFAQAVHEELLETYVRVIYDAVREVDDSLSAISFMGKRLDAQGVALDSSLRAWNFSQETFMAGAVDYLVVLDTQRTYQRNLDDWYNIRMERYRGLVSLFGALGGGVPGGDVIPGDGARPAPLPDEVDYGAVLAEVDATPKTGINVAQSNAGGLALKNPMGVMFTAALPGRTQINGVDWHGSSLRSGHWLVELSGVYDRGAVLPAWRDLRARFSQQFEKLTLLPQRQGQVNAAGKERASWFRLFIATFPDKNKAEDLCAILRAEQQRCAVVPSQSLVGKGDFIASSAPIKPGSVAGSADVEAGAAAHTADVASSGKNDRDVYLSNDRPDTARVLTQPKSPTSAEAAQVNTEKKVKVEADASTPAAQQKAKHEADAVQLPGIQVTDAKAAKIKTVEEAQAEMVQANTEKKLKADAGASAPTVQLNGQGKDAAPDDETRHARSPLPNPLGETTSHSTRLQTTAAKSLVIPQAGEGANEPLREFQVNAKREVEAVQLPLSSPELLVERWMKDWANRNVEAYLSHYDIGFQPGDGDDREAWEAKRRRRIGEAASIKVRAENLKIVRQNELMATASFVETIEVGSYKKSARKQLVLVRRDRDGEWKIWEEREETKAESLRFKAEEQARVAAEAKAEKIKAMEEARAEAARVMAAKKAKAEAEALATAELKARQEAEAKAVKIREMEQAQAEAVRVMAEREAQAAKLKAKREAEAEAEADAKARAEAARLRAEQQAQIAAEAKARQDAEATAMKIKAMEEAQAETVRVRAEKKAKADADARAAAEVKVAQLKAELEAETARLKAEQIAAAEDAAAKLKARQKAEAARVEAEQQAQAMAAEKARLLAEANAEKIKAKEEAQAEAARVKAEKKAKAEADAQAAAEAKAAKLKAERDAAAETAKLKAEQKAHAEAEKARLEKEAKAEKNRLMEEAQIEAARVKAEKKAKAEADAQAAAEAKAAKLKAKREADAEMARLKVEQKAQAAAEKQAKQQAAAEAKAAKIKAKQEAQAEAARVKAEQKANVEKDVHAIADVKTAQPNAKREGGVARLSAEQKATIQAEKQVEKQAAAGAKQLAAFSATPSDNESDGLDWSGRQFWLVEMTDTYDRSTIATVLRDLRDRFPQQMENRTILPRRLVRTSDAGEERASRYQLFIAKFTEKPMADEFCAMLRAAQQHCGVVSSRLFAGKEGLSAPSMTGKAGSDQATKVSRP